MLSPGPLSLKLPYIVCAQSLPGILSVIRFCSLLQLTFVGRMSDAHATSTQELRGPPPPAMQYRCAMPPRPQDMFLQGFDNEPYPHEPVTGSAPGGDSGNK